ncbi:MAG: hypothetical protein H0T43_06230, partial [Solirubrobacterales bacterium]|nr:hypothetical protein [Solirubrobacterales bacterium]
MADAATTLPGSDDLARAEAFTRETFVHAGEEPLAAIGPGTARRHALDAAVAEIDAGAKHPSTEWRRRFSLMLGLERVLSEEEPRLADGTSLNPHQVDALSGTLTALLAEAQRNGDAPAPIAAPVLAVDDDPDEAELDPGEAELDPGEEELDAGEAELDPGEEGLDAGEDDDLLDSEDDDLLDSEDDEDDEEDDEDEPEPDEDAPEAALDADQLDEAPDDPNAHKRFWFEHATGAGKTVAAMGFV